MRAGRRRRDPGRAFVPATGGRRPRSAERALLHLQRQAGNWAAVAVLTGATREQPAPALQRSATTSKLEEWKADAHPTDTYELGVDALTNDPVGHAWIDIAERQGKKRTTTVGFWPAISIGTFLGGGMGMSPIGGLGELQSPDEHAGQQMHRGSHVIDRSRFLDVLNTVNAWEGSYYQLLYRNCAHFANAAWQAGTRHPDAISNASGPTIWTPGEQGDVIDAANRARGLDPMGRPLEQGGQPK